MKLKVCGMKYPENIIEVEKLRPDFLGFIFYEKSPRYLEVELPEIDPSIKKVGVFVDPSIEVVLEKISNYKLSAVQLHGSESPEFCSEVKSNAPSIELIKVFSIKDDFDFGVLKRYEEFCDFYLFDTKGKLPGGNGYQFDWRILEKYTSIKPYFLSGGIGLDSIEDLRQFQKKKASKYCYALDVNSKFETEPGMKKVELLSDFRDLIFNQNKTNLK